MNFKLLSSTKNHDHYQLEHKQFTKKSQKSLDDNAEFDNYYTLLERNKSAHVSGKRRLMWLKLI